MLFLISNNICNNSNLAKKNEFIVTNRAYKIIFLQSNSKT